MLPDRLPELESHEGCSDWAPEALQPAPTPKVVERSSTERLEKAQEQHELSVEASKPQQWPDRPQWAEDEKSAKVNPMTCWTFAEKLRAAGVYVVLNEFSKAGRIGVNAVSNGIYRTITTLQFPASYEYSVMRFNEYGVPTNERFRGWRTALLHLIAANVLSADKAREVFGDPTGPLAYRYLREVSER